MMCAWRSGGCPLDLWSDGTFSVEELEDKIEDEPKDHVEFGDDEELESEIEAIVGSLEPTEESDAIEVLTTWKQTRTAMAQEKLNRGLRTPVRQHSNSTPIAKTAPKPDLQGWQVARGVLAVEKLAMYFSRICPKKRVQAPGSDAGVRAEPCDLELPAVADVMNHIRRN